MEYEKVLRYPDQQKIHVFSKYLKTLIRLAELMTSRKQYVFLRIFL